MNKANQPISNAIRIMKSLAISLSFFLCAILLFIVFFYPGVRLFAEIVQSVSFDSPSVMVGPGVPVVESPAANGDAKPDETPAESVPEYQGEIVYPEFGDMYATLTVENRGMIELPVYWGDDYVLLRKGIGHFLASDFPGEGGKIVYSAHRDTYFKDLGKLRMGDDVVIRTAYGVFTYGVSDIRIVKIDDETVLEPDDTKEVLVMYTCYPFDIVGYKSERYVVFADLSSGPKLRKWGDDN